MPRSSKNKKLLKALIVVAHPDDETIFFGGTILSLPRHWSVLVVTDGNADGNGKRRASELKKACQKLGVKSLLHWNLPDQYNQRLNTVDLIGRLKTHFDKSDYSEIYTHSPMGDYGHPHHQDVSYAVHQAFSPRLSVWCVAYNGFPERRVELTQATFKKKCDILSKTYFSETQRFLNILPASFSEGFLKCSKAESAKIYKACRITGKLPTGLKKFRWLKDYLKSGHLTLVERKF